MLHNERTMKLKNKNDYFPYGIQIGRKLWDEVGLDGIYREVQALGQPNIMFIRQLAGALNKRPQQAEQVVPAGLLNLYAMLEKIYRHVYDLYVDQQLPVLQEEMLARLGHRMDSTELQQLLVQFAENFPGASILERQEDARQYIAADADGGRKRLLLRELWLLSLSGENKALDSFRQIFDAPVLKNSDKYQELENIIDKGLAAAPPMHPFDMPLPLLLRAPMFASPYSLQGQIDYIRINWRAILPPDLLAELLTAMDIVKEEERQFWEGPGNPQVLEFLKGKRLGKGGYDYPEYDRFSPDADWMANVVMMAKMVYVWLDQLSRKYQRQITSPGPGAG